MITIDQLDLSDVYRTFHPKTMNSTFSSSTHGTFSRIDHILGLKSSLDKFKKIENTPSIVSVHSAVRLNVNYRGKKTIKNSNIQRLNNTLLNNQQITEEIKKEKNICIEMKMKTQQPKTYGACSITRRSLSSVMASRMRYAKASVRNWKSHSTLKNHKLWQTNI